MTQTGKPALRLLGNLSFSDGTGRATKLRTQKALLLLACLAANPGQAWSRERLADLLWGDRQDEQARNSLRTALSDIRKAIGNDALLVEGNTVRLQSGAISTDLDRLRDLARSRQADDLGSLDAIYGGEFLAECDGAIAAADWLAAMRTDARDLASAILEREVDRLSTAGNLDAALLRARELLSLDPLRETSHRRLMRLYADAGERSKAIAQYRSCRQLLQRELGVEPAEETRRLADEIAVTTEAALSDLKRIAEAPAQPVIDQANRPEAAGKRGERIVSIAVLPFVNMSGDAVQDYFAEGFSEDITIDLAKVAGLSVIASGSTRMYRATTVPPSQIAAELGVDCLLAGTVRRSKEKLRITTSLIDGRSNRQIWGERYDREFVEIFDLQSEIADSVVRAVHAEITPASVRHAGRRGTENLEAHEHYLRGRALLKEMSRRSVELSKSSFERAIKADDLYALAYAGLAESITMLGWHYEAAQPLLDDAHGHCQQALRLDPGLAEAHCSLGRFHSLYLRFDEAEQAFDRAIEISPTLHQAYLYRALMHLTVGRAEAAIAPMRRAFELGKQDLHTGMMLINCENALGLAEERLATATALWSLAQRRMSLNPYDDQAAYVGAFALNALGNKTDALRWANVAAAYDIDDPRSTYNIACLFAVLGEADQALRFLRKTLDLGVPQVKLEWIRHHDSDWAALRQTPRFQEIVRKY